MGKRYYVTLSEEERSYLQEMVQRGKTQGYRIKHAQILLKLDEIAENKNWPIRKICEAYQCGHSSVSEIAKRFVLEGMEAALGRKKQQNRRHKVDGEVEAHIVTIACSEAPEGRARWTLQLIADEVVRLGVVESISDTTVLNILKKTNLSLGKRKNGVSPNQERSL